MAEESVARRRGDKDRNTPSTFILLCSQCCASVSNNLCFVVITLWLAKWFTSCLVPKLLIKSSLLLLRSFGDFTIAISVLRRVSLPLPFRLIASSHLQPLFLDLIQADPQLKLEIEFVDFNIKHKILGYFPNRHSPDPHSFAELMRLRKFMRTENQETRFIFEQQKKL